MQRALLPVVVPGLLVCYGIEESRDWFLPLLLRKSHEIASTVRPRGARPVALVLRDGTEIQSICMGHFDPYGYAHNLRIEKRDAEAFALGSEAFEVHGAHLAILQPRPMIDVSADDNRRWWWVPQTESSYRRFGRWIREQAAAWSEPVPTWVTPAMLERQVLGEAVMTWEDLQMLAGDELNVGLEISRRRSEPWTAALLLLLGLSLVLRSTVYGSETSYTRNIIIGIILCAGFYILRAGTFSLGESETLPPGLATWLPAIVLGMAGVYTYQRLEPHHA